MQRATVSVWRPRNEYRIATKSKHECRSTGVCKKIYSEAPKPKTCCKSEMQGLRMKKYLNRTWMSPTHVSRDKRTTIPGVIHQLRTTARDGSGGLNYR